VGGTQCPQSAEILDPVAQSWLTTAPIPVAYPGPTTAVLLQDHRVLVVGANGADIYDPAADTWSATGGMAPVTNPSGVLLPSGSVAIVDDPTCGFFGGNPVAAQIFTPLTGTWVIGSTVGFCSTAKPAVSALATGNILVAGAMSASSLTNEVPPLSWWSVYQPASNAWGGTPNPLFLLDLFGLPLGGSAVAQPLLDGRVLLVGGTARVAQPSSSMPTPTVQLPAPISPLFDPVTSYWTPEPALTIGRTDHAVVILQNGDVLAIGGQGIATGSGALASVERLNMGTLPNANPPVLSLAGGTYNTPQILTLTATTGETIYYTYTANGTAPTTSSTVYTGPITINVSGVVEAMATAPYYAQSPVTSATYTIPATPTLSINCSPNPVSYQQLLTCSSTVSGDHGGTIALTINGSSWASGAPDGNGAFSASRTVGVSSGTYTVTANYSGDTNYASASASVAVTAQPATPTLSINCTPNPVSYQQQLTCSSTVSGDLGGTIALTINGNPWASGAPDGSGTFSASRTVHVSSGTWTVTANYSGDTNYSPTSTSVAVTAQP